mgnify:CR=1 FL=1
MQGIYYNELNGNTYLVLNVKKNIVHVNSVVVSRIGTMLKVLDDVRGIPLDVFEKFKHSGNYTKEDIND